MTQPSTIVWVAADGAAQVVSAAAPAASATAKPAAASSAAVPAETRPHISVEPNHLPTASSTLATQTDQAYLFVTYLSIAFFVVVIGPMLYFVVKYKRKSADEKTSPIDHHLTLEIVWTVIPTALLMYLFWIGIQGYANASVAPNEAYQVEVTGQMFNWTFTYPDGTVTTDLYLPKDRPVKLLMSSKDVIHSFFVPEFRVKQDVVPGMYTTLWFTPTREMESAVECAEFCGDGHSRMLTKVFVLGGKDFDAFAANGFEDPKHPMPPAVRGKKKYDSLCSSCHSTDGTRIQGPTFKGVWGRKEHLQDGSNITVDENYVRQSIMQPQSQIVDGYPPTMPTFSYLKDKDIEGIIAFLKEQK
jgi:cytochrome c oxidase subunit 2